MYLKSYHGINKKENQYSNHLGLGIGILMAPYPPHFRHIEGLYRIQHITVPAGIPAGNPI